MKNRSSNHDTEKKRSSVLLSKKELLKDIPPVAILNFHRAHFFSIENEEDVTRFTKGVGQSSGWINKAEDDITPANPLLSEGLFSAVKNICNMYPNVHFESFGDASVIEEKWEVIFYRSACELINNALQHASATHVFVQVMAENDFISITVHDDGKGFDPQTVAIGTGLRNIATAIIACRGNMKIYSSPEGTEINIEIE